MLGQFALDLEREHMTWSLLVLSLPYGVEVVSFINYWFGEAWKKVKNTVNRAIGREFITDVIEPQSKYFVVKRSLVTTFVMAIALLLLAYVFKYTRANRFVSQLGAFGLKIQKSFVKAYKKFTWRRLSFFGKTKSFLSSFLRTLTLPLWAILFAFNLAIGQVRWMFTRVRRFTPRPMLRSIWSYIAQFIILITGLFTIVFIQPVHPLIVFTYCLATILYFRTFKVAGSMISLFGLARWAGVVAFGPLAIIATAVHYRAKFDATIGTPGGVPRLTVAVPQRPKIAPRRAISSSSSSGSSSSDSEDDESSTLDITEPYLPPDKIVLLRFHKLVERHGDKVVEHLDDLEELKFWYGKMEGSMSTEYATRVKEVITKADKIVEKNLVAESLVAIHNDDEDILVTPVHGIINDDVITTSYLSILARIFRNPFVGAVDIQNINEMLESGVEDVDISDLLVLPLTTEGHNTNPDKIKHKSKKNKSGKSWRRNIRRTKPKRRGAGWVNSNGEYAYYTYEEMQKILDDPEESAKHSPEDRIRMRIALSARDRQTLYGSYDRSQPWMRKHQDGEEDKGHADDAREPERGTRAGKYGGMGTAPIRAVEVVSDKGFKGRKFVYGESNVEIFDDNLGAQLVADKPSKKRGLVSRAREAIRHLFFPKLSNLPERVEALLSRIRVDMKRCPELVKQAVAGRHYCEIPESPSEVKLTTEAKFKTDGIIGVDEARKSFRVMLEGNEVQRCTYVNHKFVTTAHNLTDEGLSKIEIFGGTDPTKHLKVDIDKVERVAGTDCLMITPKTPGQIRNTLTGKLESMKQNGIINNKHGATPSQGSVVCYVSPDGAVWTGNLVKVSDSPVETPCTVNGTLKTPALMTTAGTDKGKGSCGTALYDPATRSIVGIHFASSAELKQNYAINLYEVFKLYSFQGPKNVVAPVPSKP